MTNPLPSGVEAVSLAATGNNAMNYFVLGSDQRVYSLGKNDYGVLGQGNTTESTTWLTVKNSAGSAPLEEVKFLSAQHARNIYPTVSVIQNK
jgi:alpha-tubulin suppressor-like RCC1 family protein